MPYYNRWAYGEITIIRKETKECKVLFDGKFDLPYDYYSEDKLELEVTK